MRSRSRKQTYEQFARNGEKSGEIEVVLMLELQLLSMKACEVLVVLTERGFVRVRRLPWFIRLMNVNGCV